MELWKVGERHLRYFTFPQIGHANSRRSLVALIVKNPGALLVPRIATRDLQGVMANFVPVPAEVETPPPQQRKQRNQQGQDYYYQPPSPEDLAYAAHLAVQTIEYLFSPDNLAQDQYLRSLFDVDGRVPLLYVAQYPQVAYLGADWSGLKGRVKESRILEWDESNETIRVRENWQMWVPRGVSHKYSMPGNKPNSDTNASTNASTDTNAAGGSEMGSSPAAETA